MYTFGEMIFGNEIWISEHCDLVEFLFLFLIFTPLCKEKNAEKNLIRFFQRILITPSVPMISLRLPYL